MNSILLTHNTTGKTLTTQLASNSLEAIRAHYPNISISPRNTQESKDAYICIVETACFIVEVIAEATYQEAFEALLGSPYFVSDDDAPLGLLPSGCIDETQWLALLNSSITSLGVSPVEKWTVNVINNTFSFATPADHNRYEVTVNGEALVVSHVEIGLVATFSALIQIFFQQLELTEIDSVNQLQAFAESTLSEERLAAIQKLGFPKTPLSPVHTPASLVLALGAYLDGLSIAERNDYFRTHIKKLLATIPEQPFFTLTLTGGVHNSIPAQKLLHELNAFKPDSAKDEDGDNSYGENDFGALSINGVEVFFKFDYFDMELDNSGSRLAITRSGIGASTPEKATSTFTVLTVMLASEY